MRTRDVPGRWRKRRAEAYEWLWLAARTYAYHRRRLPVGARLHQVRLPLPACTLRTLRPDVPAEAVALTVDDGPDPRWTPRVLDLLEEHRAAATFFLIGANVERHPALARRIAAAGHTVGNHSLRHPQPFAARTAKQIRDEIVGAQRSIEDGAQVAPRLFRAPGGGWSPRVLQQVADAGLVPVDWDVDPRDWTRPPAARISATLRRASGGDILICHDGGDDRTRTVEALRTTVPELQHRGLHFVRL